MSVGTGNPEQQETLELRMLRECVPMNCSFLESPKETHAGRSDLQDTARACACVIRAQKNFCL